jgi:hypothetical protein
LSPVINNDHLLSKGHDLGVVGLIWGVARGLFERFEKLIRRVLELPVEAIFMMQVAAGAMAISPGKLHDRDIVGAKELPVPFFTRADLGASKRSFATL